MKKLLIFITVLSLMSCSKKQPESVDNNLISNPSFEDANGFSFQDWNGALTSSSTDTPSNGGSYALQIKPAGLQLEPPHEGYAETLVTGLQGAITLHFSCDVKVNSTSLIPGYIRILKENQNGVRTEISNINFNNTQWQNISFNINTVLDQTGSLVIHFSAGANELSGLGTILFDNVTLTN